MPGGVWLNLGPLLWHFADQLVEKSIELSWDDVKSIITAYGFDIVEEYDVKSTYTSNCRSAVCPSRVILWLCQVEAGQVCNSGACVCQPTQVWAICGAHQPQETVTE